MSEPPRLRFWRELNDALAARGIKGATYGEVRDFWDSGYRDAAAVARSWIPDDAEDRGALEQRAWYDTSAELL